MRKILALVLCLLMMLLFVSCKGNEKVNTKILEQAMTDELYAGADLFESTDAKFVNFIEENNEFKVISFEENGDIVTAEVEVVSPNLYTAAINLSSTSVEDNLDEVNELLIEEMKKADDLNSVVEIEFEISGDSIKTILTDEFLDAYYGGVFKLREKQLEDIFTDTDGSDDQGQSIDVDNSDKEESTDEISIKNASNSESSGNTIKTVECSGFIEEAVVDVSDDGYFYQSDEEWIVETTGITVFGKITYNKNFSGSELKGFSHGGTLTLADGTNYEGDDCSFWSDYEAGEFAVEIPSHIKGDCEISVYQFIGEEQGEIIIKLNVA